MEPDRRTQILELRPGDRHSQLRSACHPCQLAIRLFHRMIGHLLHPFG